MRRLIAGVLILSLAGCGVPEGRGSEGDPEHQQPAGEGEAMVNRKGLTASTSDLVIDAGITGQDRADLQALIDDGRALLASDGFSEDMARLNGAYPRVWRTAELGFADAVAVRDLIVRPTGQARYVRTRVVLRGDANTFKIGVGDDPLTADGSRLLSIGRGHLGRYRSASEIEKSCAINSITHEITHTISRSQSEFHFAITDTGASNREGRRGPMASYLVGSVAQCSSLRQSGRIAADEMAQCVRTFGVRPKFQSGQCRLYDPPGPAALPPRE